MSVVELVEAKTSDLVGAALAWAIGAVDGRRMEVRTHKQLSYVVWLDPFTISLPGREVFHDKTYRNWEPHLGGIEATKLIHKHAVTLEPADPWVEYGNQWQAMCITHRDDAPHSFHTQHGPDPITAGLRAIVGAVSGETVLIPTVLME